MRARKVKGLDPDGTLADNLQRIVAARLDELASFVPKAFDPTEVKALADALGERRDPDVQLAQLDEFAAAVKPADRPGVELFAERVRSEQGSANESLAAAIAELEETDLRGRLASLAANTASDRQSDDDEGEVE